MRAGRGRGSRSVVPTHVGVYRRAVVAGRVGDRCPHARGGVPTVPSPNVRTSSLSPRTWGCTARAITCKRPQAVVPTHVGVYRNCSLACAAPGRCPHARGGVPFGAETPFETGPVVPTHVGVYRRVPAVALSALRCPHARGGVPLYTRAIGATTWLSPRTWGCTEAEREQVPPAPVVPTHVGVYRRRTAWIVRPVSCPHARGGVPMRLMRVTARGPLSPRTWGCTDRAALGLLPWTVVPTHVGVYR